MIEQKKEQKKEQTIGLALGAGGAKGFVHIGVLKTLYKYKIFPDYIAGTSMGSVIAAAYACGRNPEEIESFLKHTNWRRIVDFTIPKSGLLEGKRIDRRISELVFKKKFRQCSTPLRIIAYNLTKKEKVVFTKGDITKALRASISIPGIFPPFTIHQDQYIDGAVIDPTPFKEVKEMGADIVITVDLSSWERKTSKKSSNDSGTYLISLKEEFIKNEVKFLGTILFPRRWPKAIRNFLRKLFNTIFYPARILRMLAGRELYPIANTMYKTINILSENLAKEQIAHAENSIIIKPEIDGLSWSDFDKIDRFIKIGEEATERIIPDLKKKLGLTS